MYHVTGNPHLMEVQLEADPAVVDRVRMDADRLEDTRTALHMDFGLLAFYGTTLTLLGVLLLLRRKHPLHRALGWAAVLGAALTMGLDALENRLSLQVLPESGSGDLSRSTLDWLQEVSYAKWTTSVLTVAVLTRVFTGLDGGLVGRGRILLVGRGRVWLVVRVIAALTALAVLVGAAGLVAGVAAGRPDALGLYFLLLFVVLCLVAGQCFLTEERLRRGF